MTTLSIDSLITDPSGSENGLVVRNIPSGIQKTEITDGYGNILGTTNSPLIVSSGTNTRTVKTFSAIGVAGTLSEFMVTLTPASNFTTSSTGTSFTVTSGKILRLQYLNVIINSAKNTGGVIRLKISNSGAVNTSTLTVNAVSFWHGTSGETFQTLFPDGLELSGSMQLGISYYGTNSGNDAVDIYLTGYEY